MGHLCYFHNPIIIFPFLATSIVLHFNIPILTHFSFFTFPFSLSPFCGVHIVIECFISALDHFNIPFFFIHIILERKTDALNHVKIPMDVDGLNLFWTVCPGTWTAWICSGRPTPGPGRPEFVLDGLPGALYAPSCFSTTLGRPSRDWAGRLIPGRAVQDPG